MDKIKYPNILWFGTEMWRRNRDQPSLPNLQHRNEFCDFFLTGFHRQQVPVIKQCHNFGEPIKPVFARYVKGKQLCYQQFACEIVLYTRRYTLFYLRDECIFFYSLLISIFRQKIEGNHLCKRINTIYIIFNISV